MSSQLDPSFLPPGVRAETFTYRNGRKTTVYKAPYQTEGPVVRKAPNGRRVLVFVYASFVFEWSEGSGSVLIGMGTLRRYSRNWSQPIHAPWSEQALTQFGQQWALAHMAKFRTRRPQDT
ncbi:hypothetical protein EV191_1359 [Tamaricihabitans halophyticus]|uniref:Uncharacterized protein n=1 Tax=Tamaricihabitans halophyticus TaxID=1262583 RepID=A0A4R2PXC5_9PSEU|nr:hypothetical protein EV191_1359 [Tamaricihabitans halophyticus]